VGGCSAHTITFFDGAHLKFVANGVLTAARPQGILNLDDELLPDDVLYEVAHGCVSHGLHLWQEEFPDLALA
jgi:hypothetical protein